MIRTRCETTDVIGQHMTDLVVIGKFVSTLYFVIHNWYFFIGWRNHVLLRKQTAIVILMII